MKTPMKSTSSKATMARPKAQSPKEALAKATKMTADLAAQGIFTPAKKAPAPKPIKTTNFLSEMAAAVSKPKKAK